MNLEARPEGRLWQRIDRTDAARTLFVAGCSVIVALGVTWPGDRAPALAFVALIVGCWPILSEAIADARHRRMSMEVSMLIAVIAAAAIGEWITALVITTFVLAAEILEDLSMDRGRDALTDLMAFLPDTVQLLEHGKISSAPLSQVQSGQTIVVSPGGRIPVDGTVSSGHSTIDESRITGEPLPVDVTVGHTVLAGSVNQVGALDIHVDRVGADSSYGRIIEAIRRAQSSEPPIQRLADRFAARIVYLALAGAILTFLVTRDLTATISVIVVAGACGIAAGTPLAVLAAIARIARSGAFVKDGAHLEVLSSVDTVVFDKTGTLTEGTPTVTGISLANGTDEDGFLSLVAGAESYSEHPLGRAIVAYVRTRGLPIPEASDFSYVPGRGVTAMVMESQVAVGKHEEISDAPPQSATDPARTAVHAAIDGRYSGTLFLTDQVRKSSGNAIAALHREGIRTVMLTGDSGPTANAVAEAVGIDEVHPGLRPEEKMEIIDAERATGHRVLMVGDGVNDAPALARADVGMAMGSGTDIARDSADIVLISSDLHDLVRTVHTARRARRIIRFNFVGTVTVDVIGIALAAAGILSPVLAAFIHVGSETAFILNSARLIPHYRK